MIYHFDVVGLAFLGQDMSTFHVCAQIHMFLGSLPCLCIDLHAYEFFALFLLRSTCWCLDLCVYVLRAMLVCSDLYWLLCHVLLQPFMSLDISLSCFLALLVGCRSRSCGIGPDLHTQAYIKGLGSFPLHANVCLLAIMLYLHVSLSRSSLCRALHPSWTCACVITSIPHRVCLGITTCEIHSYGVGVLDSRLSLPRLMLIRLPCLLCSTHLAFFASLHLCMLAYMFICEFVCRPYLNPMEVWTFNPNHHFSSQDTPLQGCQPPC